MQQHNCLCSHTAFRIIFKPSSLNIFLPQYIPSSIYFFLNIFLNIHLCSQTNFDYFLTLQILSLYIFPPIHFPIYLCLNIFLNVPLQSVTLHFRLFSNLHASIYFPTPFSRGGWGQMISVYTKSFPITAIWSQLASCHCFSRFSPSWSGHCLFSAEYQCALPVHTYIGDVCHAPAGLYSINNGDFIISRILIQFKGLSWIWAEFRPFYESLQCTLVYFRVGQTSWQCLESIYKIKADFGSICRIEADFRFILGTF